MNTPPEGPGIPAADPISSLRSKLSASPQEETSDLRDTNNALVDMNILISNIAQCCACKLCGGEMQLEENVAERVGVCQRLQVELFGVFYLI